MAPKKLVPSYSDSVKQNIKDTDERLKQMQKFYHDRRHNARDKLELQPGDRVLIRDRKEEATVKKPAENAPRSVIVSTDNSVYRRNTRMLDRLPQRPPRNRQPPRKHNDFVKWSDLK
jgi:predicted RNase H-like nuclease (RuvC/YqgF family)